MKQIDIFYAEDDDDDVMFFNEAVERISDTESRINLHICKNGEKLIECITQVNSKNPIVFLDINMPLKSGFQLLEEIRKNPDTKHIPVIMFSTSSSQDNIDNSLSLGANFYVVKPYEFAKLIKMITTFTAKDWESHQSDASTFLYQ